MLERLCCPLHTDEIAVWRRLDDGVVEYTCSLTRGHPGDKPWVWTVEPPPLPGTPVKAKPVAIKAVTAKPANPQGLAADLNLATELPGAVNDLRALHGHRWFEFGLVERAYARRRPADFALLVERYGHASHSSERINYSASTYLARTLGALGRSEELGYHQGPATGPWSDHAAEISWWAAPGSPLPDWSNRLSWAEAVDAEPDGAEDARRAYVPQPDGTVAVPEGSLGSTA